MSSAILIENGADQESMKRTIASLLEPHKQSLTIIAATQPEGMSAGQTFISSTTNTLAEAMQQAISRCQSDTVLMLDARMTPSRSTIASVLDTLRSNNAGFAYAAVDNGSESISLGDTSADTLITMLSSNSSWPLMCVAAKKSLVDACGRLEGENMIEILVKVLVEAVASGEAISQSTENLQAPSKASASNMSEMSNSASARCLRKAIDSLNIEDIYPHHAWSAHREESAAASYHSLAATFIRLGDPDSALECLNLGDQFEDSPRSLALKGIIALDRGEELAAVANMVSSLQQYEVRKKQNNKHYVHFAPRDLAGINTQLNAGLEALNKKDNASAIEHFASAVFSFDSFYSEHGVNAIKNMSN